VPVLAVLEVLYAIPSLAFFALLIPFTGLGTKTAVIVLICYSLFFLVRNFLGGLDDIDPLIKEAGRAMGYSPFWLFRKVELPLAMPAMIAGIRMACVSTTGIACIAYAIGAGGIGTILFEGMRQLSYVKIAWGALLAILLSAAVNNILLALERHFARRARPGA
jgi:osmoprotectant transport system permease protein